MDFLSRMAEQIRNISQSSDVLQAEDFTATRDGPKLPLLAEDALRRLGRRLGLHSVDARLPGLVDGVSEELRYGASQSRVAEIKTVSVTLQRDESSTRNPRRQFEARFERDRPVVAVVEYQGRHTNVREQIPKVHFVQCGQEVIGH